MECQQPLHSLLHLQKAQKIVDEANAKKSVIVDSKTMATEQRAVREIFCPMATHLEIVEPEIYKKLNPIKASKRKMRGRRR